MMYSTAIKALTIAALPTALTIATYQSQSAPENESGAILDLSEYHVTFDEPFDRLSVSAWGPNTRWIAHTPWNGDFGDAKFVDPQQDFPFTVDNGILRIEARKLNKSKWESGLLAANDLKGNGFAQRGGYFEIRAKLPGGKGVWPAFWLMGTERSQYAVELDVVEFYGHDPRALHSVYHIWSMDKIYPEKHVPNNIKLPIDIPGAYHTFGVLVDPKWITFYFDRRPIWRFELPKEFDQPLFPLLNLALGSGFSIEETPNPSYMYVDYVRVYQK